MTWLDQHGSDAERTLLLVAGAAFLGSLAFLGEAWTEIPAVRPIFVSSLFWFARSMTTTLVAAAIRIFGGRLLKFSAARSLYFLLLAAGLGMLAHGGLRIASALESAAGGG